MTTTTTGGPVKGTGFKRKRLHGHSAHFLVPVYE